MTRDGCGAMGMRGFGRLQNVPCVLSCDALAAARRGGVPRVRSGAEGSATTAGDAMVSN